MDYIDLLVLLPIAVALVAGYRWCQSKRESDTSHHLYEAPTKQPLPNQPVSVPLNNQGSRTREMDYTLKYLQDHFGSQLVALYLFGSRARGTGRPNSDHDFMAVVEDSVSGAMETGGEDWSRFIVKFNRDRTAAGIGAIDLLIKRKTPFDDCNEEGFALRVKTEGVLVK